MQSSFQQKGLYLVMRLVLLLVKSSLKPLGGYCENVFNVQENNLQKRKNNAKQNFLYENGLLINLSTLWRIEAL